MRLTAINLPAVGTEGAELTYDLQDLHVPEFLGRLHRMKVTGVLTVATRREEISMFVSSGFIVHVTCSDPRRGLESYLSEDSAKPLRLVASRGKRKEPSSTQLAIWLLEQGAFSPGQMLAAIERRALDLIFDAFDAKEGQISFRHGSWLRGKRIQLKLPIASVVLDGVRRSPDVSELIARMGGCDVVPEPRFVVQDLVEMGLDGREARLLDLVDAVLSLGELCGSGPFSPSRNAWRLYAFYSLGLIQPPIAETPRPAVEDLEDWLIRLVARGAA